MIKPPFTADEFLAAVPETFALPENALFLRDKPRASGLGNDAREIAYYMAATPPDVGHNSRREADGALTAEQGRMFEDLSVRVIENLGYYVTCRQVTLPDDFCVTGHPDGMLNSLASDLGFSTGRLKDGLAWGFEHKHLGRWAYTEILQQGLYKAKPEYILQATLYGAALGWDAACFVIVSQDAAAIRTDITQNLEAKNPRSRWATPEMNPKVLVLGVDLRPLYDTLLPAAKVRALWFTDWFNNSRDPRDVQLEYDPAALDSRGRWAFPWGYSEYQARAIADGQSGRRAPSLPFTGKWA